MRTLSPFGLAALVVLGAAPAAAQGAPSRADKVAADVLFDDGKKLMLAHRYQEACPKFEESNRLDPGVGILLYLADCYRRMGRTASAWTTFREAAGAARIAGQPDREKIAHRFAEELEPTLSRVILTVLNAEQQQGLTLKRNGVVIGRALWGSALPVDPGPQQIEASAEGKTPWSTRVEAAPPGQTLTVTVPPLEPLPAATPPPAPTPTAPSASPAPTPPPPTVSTPGEPGPAGSPRRTAALVAGGVGLIGVGLATYLGLRTFSLWDESRGGCPNNQCSTDASYEAATQARRSGNLSTLFFGIGAVGLGAGAWLWFSAPSSPQTAIAPAISPLGGGLSVRREW